MKRSLFILTLAATVLLFGCSKIAPVCEPGAATASFTVRMEDLTKATADNDGAGAGVNRCILQIWKGNEIYKTVVRTAPAGTREYSFRGVTLEPDQTYDFLFWADCGTGSGGDLYYSTESLKNVRMLNPAGAGDDAADAFCNRLRGCKIDSQYEEKLILKRPLAQLNIITRDLQAVSRMPLYEDFRIESISYSFYGCTAYDVLDARTVGEAALISVSDVPVYGTPGDDGNCTLSMNYLFPAEGSSVSPLDISLKPRSGAPITHHCDNVSFKSNWRTNIIGNLLTVEGGFSVQVKPMFDGEFNPQP